MKKLFNVCSLAAVLTCAMAFNAMACPIKISTIRPLLAPNALPLETFVIGGNIHGFDPTGITFNSINSHALGMEGRGNAYGFVNTPINRLISENNTGNTPSYSAPDDVKPVPEPATLLLLGLGLAGVGTFSRKKSKI